MDCRVEGVSYATAPIGEESVADEQGCVQLCEVMCTLAYQA